MASTAPVREGLGLQKNAAAAFNDEQILSSVQATVSQSKVNPIIRLQIQAGEQNLGVRVIGQNNFEAYTCVLNKGAPDCSRGALNGPVNASVEVPFGSLQDYGIKIEHGMSYSTVASWVAVSLVGFYAVKKVIAYWKTGSPFMSEHDHEHSVFHTPEESRAELIESREIMDRVMAVTFRAMDQQLLELVRPLALAASCGHDHRHPVCMEVSAGQVQAARQSLLRKFPNLAVKWAKDFYNETIDPLVQLSKALADKQKRAQIWTDLDLISRRMYNERGLVAAAITGVAVGTAQLVFETLEHVVIGAAAGFCHVGNAFILWMANTTYYSAYCMAQTKEFKGTSIGHRWKVARQISRMMKDDAKAKTPDEKIVQALNLLFYQVEADVRHGRIVDGITKPIARALAWELGQLRAELNLMSIRVLNKTATAEEVKLWLEHLYDVQSKAQADQHCEASLTAA